MESTGVIIVAGGGGSRMGATLPKQFLMLESLPILAHTVNAFASALPDATIVVVLPSAHMDLWGDLAARFEVAAHVLVEGGAERFHSVRNGLDALPEDIRLIAIQDGVRPLASRELILRTIAAAAEHGAAIPVVEPVDSFREVDGEASRIIDRSRLRIVQTPQVFRAEVLRKAYRCTFEPSFTDDASVVERYGFPIFLCEGERTNIKITTPGDLTIAQALLAQRNQHNDGEHL